jgi:hypothetical protein
MCSSSASRGTATGTRQAPNSAHLPACSTCPIPTWPSISSGMPRPTIPSSRASRVSLPPIRLEVPCSRFARSSWSLLALVTAGAFWLSGGPHPTLLLIAAAAAGALWWPAGRAVVLGQGPAAVPRFEWDAEGQWWLESLNGRRQEATLLGVTSTLGPWLLMVWSVRGGAGWARFRRRYALLDVRCVDLVMFRALKGRLLLASRRVTPAGDPARVPQLVDSSHLPHASGHNPDRAGCRR